MYPTRLWKQVERLYWCISNWHTYILHWHTECKMYTFHTWQFHTPCYLTFIPLNTHNINNNNRPKSATGGTIQQFRLRFPMSYTELRPIWNLEWCLCNRETASSMQIPAPAAFHLSTFCFACASHNDLIYAAAKLCNPFPGRHSKFITSSD